jgi:hypothetical protein
MALPPSTASTEATIAISHIEIFVIAHSFARAVGDDRRSSLNATRSRPSKTCVGSDEIGGDSSLTRSNVLIASIAGSMFRRPGSDQILGSGQCSFCRVLAVPVGSVAIATPDCSPRMAHALARCTRQRNVDVDGAAGDRRVREIRLPGQVHGRSGSGMPYP